MNGDTNTSAQSANASTVTWRCTSCGALLGRDHEGALEIRIKRAVYWTTGDTHARCARCGTPNSYARSKAQK